MTREFLKNIKSENRLNKIRLIMPDDFVIGGQPSDNESEFNSNTPFLDIACTMKFAIDEASKANKAASTADGKAVKAQAKADANETTLKVHDQRITNAAASANAANANANGRVSKDDVLIARDKSKTKVVSGFLLDLVEQHLSSLITGDSNALKELKEKVDKHIDNHPAVIDALGDSKKDAASQRIVNVVNKLAKDAMTAAMLANEKANKAQEEAEKKLELGRYGILEYQTTAANGTVSNIKNVSGAEIETRLLSDGRISFRLKNIDGKEFQAVIPFFQSTIKNFLFEGDNGFGSNRSPAVYLSYLFGNPENGLFYTTDNDPNFVDFTPEKRGIAYVMVQNFHTSTGSYIKLSWSYSTGSMKSYEILKLNGVWQKPVEIYTSRKNSTTISPQGFLRANGSKEAVTTDELAVVMSKSKTQAVTPFLLDAELTKREQQDTRKRVDVTQDRVKDVEYINSTDMPIDIVMIVSTHSINTQSIVKLFINDEVMGHSGFLLSGTAFISYEMKTQITATVQPREKYKFTASSNAIVEKIWEFRK